MLFSIGQLIFFSLFDKGLIHLPDPQLNRLSRHITPTHRIFQFILGLLGSIFILHAQNGTIPTNAISGYAGRYFLIGFMQNEIMLLPGGLRLSVTISTIKPTTIRIAAPISRTSQFYQIPADTVIELTFPYNDVEVFDSERAQLKAVEIESDQPITVSGMSSQSLSTDGFSAVPVAKWGREYVVHSWPNDIYMHDNDPQSKFPRSSEFMVIASENNTTIQFAPRSRTFQKIQPGQLTTVVLNKGQCYLVKSDTLPAGSGDLSGTIVRSDKPVGVFGGHLRAAIPLGLQEFDSKDHLTEMMYPTDYWGKTFLTVPFTNDGQGDFFRIHCIQPNTTVSVKGWSSSQTLLLTNPGDFRTLTFIREPLLIESDKPISIAQYMTSSFSSNDRLQTFDPSMMLIPSIDKVVTRASFHVVQNPATNPRQFTRHFISLVCTEDAVDHVMLDNRLVKSLITNFPNQRMNGTQYYYATVPVYPGPHHLKTTEGAFNAALYGTGQDDAYAYPLAFGMVKGIDTSAPRITYKDSCGNIKGYIQEQLINDYSGLFDISVNRDSTFNMNWTLAGIRDGDLSAPFTASVINLLKDASILIEATDNAGNSSKSRYNYIAPNISLPDTLRFPKIRAGDTIKRSFTVRNIGRGSTVIKFGKLDGDSRITCSNILDLTEKRLAPNDSIVLSCTFIGKGSSDSANAILSISLGCGIIKQVQILASMETISMSVRGYDFGFVSVGGKKSGVIQVVNTGGVTITAQSIAMNQANDFILDTAGLFPHQISPLDTFLIPCRFTPTVPGMQLRSCTIINDKAIQNQAELKGIGILPKVNGFIVDWKERRIASINDSMARITNTGDDIAYVHLDTPIGRDTVFTMSFPGGRSDTTLAPNQSIAVHLSFSPTDTIHYTHQGFIRYSNGFIIDSAQYEVQGQGIVPVITQHDIYVGRIREQSIKDTSAHFFTSLGNMPLTIEKVTVVSGDTASFVFDKNAIIAKTYAPSTFYKLPVTFTPKRSGRHSIAVEIVSDAAPFGKKSITMSTISGDADPLDTIALRMDVQKLDTMYVCEQRVISGTITNDGNIQAKLDSLLSLSRFGATTTTIQQINDSMISPRGGTLSFTAIVEAQFPGDDIVDFTAFVQDSFKLQRSIPVYVKPNHLNVASSMNPTIEFLPGDFFTLTLQGDIDVAKKTVLSFEPVINLNYVSSSIDCISTTTEFILTTSSGEIRIPAQVTTIPGKTVLTCQTQSSIQGIGNWQTTLRFRTFLTDTPGDLYVDIKNIASNCIIGDSAIIPLELSEFCAKDIRIVTNDLKGRGFLGIYPHPVRNVGNLTFLLNDDMDYEFDIKNILGETVKHVSGKGHSGLNILPFDSEDLPNGAYTLIFQSVKTSSTRQFIITKD
ncbi:hypothetical protein EBV26_02145 [bacterium]|nr:hypothetical protein [bacterium]